MQAKNRISRNRRSQFWAVPLLLLLLATYPNGLSSAGAQGSGTTDLAEYFATRMFIPEDGTSPARTVINGPPTPPSGYEAQRKPVILPGTINTLTVPAFDWVFGCSSVSGAMIAGYYDRNGYPNMYTGSANSGVMPLNNSTTYWPTWTDGYVTYPNLPLAASHNGVDGRTTRGSIDDYWIQYASSTQDPFITNGWTEHTWSTAIGDYMKTSQSTYLNTDGSTNFFNYSSPPSAAQVTCAMMPTWTYSGFTIDQLDGTYGRKLFYEARGYTVTTCYNQMTDNTVTGGFSFAQFKAEIDAGRPVMINLYTAPNGHTIVGVGYDDSTNTVYIHDTWDYLTHSMTWGGSYSGMAMQSVSIVNLAPLAPAVSINSTSWDFGSQLVGTTSGAKSFTLTNSGAANLNVGTLSISGQFALISDNCSSQTVAPWGTCTFGVTFSPLSTGVKSGSVSIPSNASTSPDSVSLSGTGTPPPAPAVSINPTSWDFGSQLVGTTSVIKPFTLTNSGTANLNVGMLSVSGQFALMGDNCSSQIVAPSGTCTFGVTFSPLSTGVKNGSVSIPSNASTSPDSVSLSGTGTPPTAPAVSINPTSWDFGGQFVGTTSGAKSFTLTNTGTANLMVGLLTFTSDWILSNDTCSGANVIPSGACTFDVAFHPLATGPLTGTIGIPSNAASSPDTVGLTGTGYAKLTSTFRSVGANDGYILESTEISGVGGAMNSASTVFYLGDGTADKQYRAILHFDLNLPANAVITSATLKLKRQGLVGSDPFITLGKISVDIRTGAFSNNNILQLTDFKAAAHKNTAAMIYNTPVSNWYSVTFPSSAFSFINKSGVTQFRLRFQIDDNDNGTADYLKFLSGDYATAAARPTLVIEYYVP